MLFDKPGLSILAVATLLASCGDGQTTDDNLATSEVGSIDVSAIDSGSAEGTLPQDLPLYPGARDIVIKPNGKITQFVVDAAPETVANFYGAAMEENLGDSTVTGSGNFYAASFLAPSGPEQIQVICRGQGSETLVNVGGSKS